MASARSKTYFILLSLKVLSHNKWNTKTKGLARFTRKMAVKMGEGGGSFLGGGIRSNQEQLSEKKTC